MKKAKLICLIIILFSVSMAILSSCNLEKRVIITTRGYDNSRPIYSTPRDTALNYRIR